MAEALYRKYRPQVFEDVVGQEPIERTLKNAIRQDKVSHAYLFCGPRGTGKTTTARLLAKALLCEKGPTPDPDGSCEDCQLIADGVHPDVYELDAASRTGVENVREEIISRVHFAPTRGRYKVYIIDEVHMLSTAAFNALLKTLEEPPSHVVFVLCTTDPQKVPETIHSRCQRFDFHRISPEAMVARLGAICMAENVDFEGEALDLIAQRAEGGLRNALTSLEQIIAFENGKVSLAGAERLLGSIDSNDMAEILAYIGKRDIANCFRWTAAYVETGADLAQFVRDMGEHVRNLYVMALLGDDVDLEVTETARRELASELVWFGPDRAARLMGVLGDLMAELKTTSNPRLAFEIALTRMVRPDSDLTLESLAERVEALESGYSAVAHVLPGESYAARKGAAPAPASSDGAPARLQAEPTQSEPVTQGRAASGGFAPSAEGQPSNIGDRREVLQQDNAAVGVMGNDGPDAGSTSAGSAVQAAPDEGVAVPQGASEARQSVQPGAGPASGGGSKVASLANPAALQRIWQATLSDVKKSKQAYGVLFMNTKVVFDEEKGMVQVVFPAESSFAFNAVQKPDVQAALDEALAKAVGEPVQFCYVKGSGQMQVSSQPARAEASDQRAASPDFGRWDDDSQPHAASMAAPLAGQGQQPRETGEPIASESRTNAGQADFPRAGSQPDVAQEAPSDQVPYDDSSYDQVPYEDAPYDQVPYDDVSYQQVPYGEFEGASAHPGKRPSSAGTRVYEQEPAADADTTPSPAVEGGTPDGVAREDPSELQALLKESFGEGVVFSETDE